MRPVDELIAAARAVGAGDLSRRVESPTGDEIGVLATSFNQMTGRVADRTRELKVLEELGRAIVNGPRTRRTCPRSSPTTSQPCSRTASIEVPAHLSRPTALPQPVTRTSGRGPGLGVAGHAAHGPGHFVAGQRAALGRQASGLAPWSSRRSSTSRRREPSAGSTCRSGVTRTRPKGPAGRPVARSASRLGAPRSQGPRAGAGT